MRQTVFDRRALLGGAVATAALAGGFRAEAAGRPFFRRHAMPIGLQLYTLGEAPAHDLEGVLGKVAAVGFRTVELSSFYGRKPAEVRKALDAAGLTCPSTHEWLSSEADVARAAEAAHAVGAERVVAPIFAFPRGDLRAAGAGETPQDIIGRIGRQMSADDWKRQAESLNRHGEALRKAGLRLGYHNHNVEFGPRPDGQIPYEILLRETDPALVCFEIDVGWVAAAGHDPVEVLNAHRGRFELMHVKDIRASTQANFALKQDPAEVGSGSLDWKRILPAGYAAGVRRFFVEQEPPFVRDRLESARISFDYLQALVA